MVFKIIPSKSRQAAFTLVELMVAAAVSTVVLGAMLSFYLSSNRSFSYLTNHTLMEQQNSYTMDTLSKQIRRARHLTAYTTNSVTFTDYDTNTLQFIYSSTTKTLARVKQGQTNILLTDCTSLQFQMYTDKLQTNTFDVTTIATNITQCQVVGVSWTCAKSSLNISNYEQMQCAKILMRNSNGG